MSTKTCPCCKLEKPLTDFWRNQSYCKLCSKARTDEWKKANNERYRSKQDEWRQANREDQRAKRKTYIRKNRVKIAAKRRRWWTALKDRIYASLGGCCCRCGFSDRRALQIDHVNGGGKAELKKYSGGSITYLRKVLAAPPGVYQLLCANCNWIKRWENEECGPRVKPEPDDITATC